MRTYALPPPDTAAVERCRRGLSEWLAEALVWLAHAITHAPPAWRASPIVGAFIRNGEARIRRSLRYCATVLRPMLIIAAMARFQRTHPLWRRTRFPHGAAPGVRRLGIADRSIRRATNGILSDLHQGSLVQRARRLQRTLARFDALVTRLLKRFVRNSRAPRQGALVINAPQRDLIVSVTPDVAATDSS